MSGLVPFNRKKAGLNTSFDSFYNMLDDFFTESWRPGRSLMGDTFKVDVQEDQHNYIVEAELPGVKKDEIDIAIDDGRLRITVLREENIESEGKNYIHKERRCCSMQRNIYLTDSANHGIQAKLENGLLKIIVPKREKLDNSVKIEIE